MALIRTVQQHQTSKPPRARRLPTSYTEDGIEVTWGGLKLTVPVEEARQLVAAITPLLDPDPTR